MKISVLLLTLVYCAITGISQTSNITLKVKGIEEVKGKMAIALFDSEENYKSGEDFLVAETVKVTNKDFTYEFAGLENGTYAIKVYHDIDDNGGLNTNWIGMPKEPFGFSNDAKGRMGPPDYEDASFELKEDKIIVINLMTL